MDIKPSIKDSEKGRSTISEFLWKQFHATPYSTDAEVLRPKSGQWDHFVLSAIIQGKHARHGHAVLILVDRPRQTAARHSHLDLTDKQTKYFTLGLCPLHDTRVDGIFPFLGRASHPWGGVDSAVGMRDMAITKSSILPADFSVFSRTNMKKKQKNGKNPNIGLSIFLNFVDSGESKSDESHFDADDHEDATTSCSFDEIDLHEERESAVSVGQKSVDDVKNKIGYGATICDVSICRGQAVVEIVRKEKRCPTEGRGGAIKEKWRFDHVDEVTGSHLWTQIDIDTNQDIRSNVHAKMEYGIRCHLEQLIRVGQRAKLFTDRFCYTGRANVIQHTDHFNIAAEQRLRVLEAVKSMSQQQIRFNICWPQVTPKNWDVFHCAKFCHRIVILSRLPCSFNWKAVPNKGIRQVTLWQEEHHLAQLPAPLSGCGNVSIAESSTYADGEQVLVTPLPLKQRTDSWDTFDGLKIPGSHSSTATMASSRDRNASFESTGDAIVNDDEFSESTPVKAFPRRPTLPVRRFPSGVSATSSDSVVTGFVLDTTPSTNSRRGGTMSSRKSFDFEARSTMDTLEPGSPRSSVGTPRSSNFVSSVRFDVSKRHASRPSVNGLHHVSLRFFV